MSGDGIPSIGVMVAEFGGPSVIPVLAAAGFDHVIVDCEHGAFGTETVAALCAVARGRRLDLLVRTPGHARADILRYLDMGAAGLVVPMIDSAALAREVVAHARYAPLGSRGVSTRRAHADFDPGPLASYMERANREVQIWVQVESAQAVRDVERIAAVPGLTGLVLGPNDYLQDIGAPGGHDRPELAAALRSVARAARRHGLRCGTISGHPAVVALAAQEGLDLLCAGSDAALLIDAGRRLIDDLRGGATRA